jgi:hypothetical protein
MSASGELELQPFSFLADLPAEPEWLWRGYLTPGSLTMLAGHPFSGKSWLVGGLLKAMEQGEPFLGQSTEEATAVLITEEPETALRARADELGLLQLRSVYASRSSGILKDWPTLIEQATEKALNGGHRLLVIDTFPGLAGLRGEEENDAGAIAERLRPLQKAAGRGLAVLFLHHMNGQGQPRGSKAFRGIVDVSTRFSRNKKTNVVRLETESRFRVPPVLRAKLKLVKAATGTCYIPLDSVTEANKDRSITDDLLMEALAKAGAQGLTYDQVAELDGLSADMAKRRFPTWHREGKLERTCKGAKSNPYVWFLRS